MAVDKFKLMLDQEMYNAKMPKNIARHLRENYSGKNPEQKLEQKMNLFYSFFFLRIKLNANLSRL